MSILKISLIFDERLVGYNICIEQGNVKSAPLKLALVKLHLAKLLRENFAPLKSDSVKFAPKIGPGIVAPMKEASRASTVGIQLCISCNYEI